MGGWGQLDVGAPATWAFAKTTAEGGDTWKVTPDGGQAADVDRARMDDLLNKLSALRVTAFVDPARRAGLDRPVLNVGVSYDGGKFERVKVGRVGTQYFGNREGEQATGEVDTAAVDAALQALDAALVPPAPVPTPTPEAPKQ